MDAMSNGTRITPPQARDIVSAEVVDELVARRQAELARLDAEANAADHTASELEARVRAEGADESATTWAMLQLRRYLDRVFDEVDQEADAEIEVAERRARARVEAARSEAFRVAAFEPVEPLQHVAQDFDVTEAVESIDRFVSGGAETALTTFAVDDIDGSVPSVVAPEMDRAFWTDPGVKARRVRRTLGLPISTGLRVSAALLVLVAVVVRVS